MPDRPDLAVAGARLTYANAVLPEALVAIGAALGDDDTLHAGLDLLHWLVEQETHDGHLSVTPAGGWQDGDARPGLRPAADRGGRPRRSVLARVPR